MPRETMTDAPEALNREQWDEGQAQDVADDALRTEVGPGVLDSRHGGATNPAQIIPDDVPDLVDKMKEMLASGRIDTDAYAGEPVHDDEESLLGAATTDPLGIDASTTAEGIEEDNMGLLEGVADGGGDPLGAVASDYGLEDGSDPDADEDDEELEDEDDWDEDEDLEEDELDEDLEDEELDEEDELEELDEEGFMTGEDEEEE